MFIPLVLPEVVSGQFGHNIGETLHLVLVEPAQVEFEGGCAFWVLVVCAYHIGEAFVVAVGP